MTFPCYEEFVDLPAFVPTQNLPVSLEFPQLLGSVVRRILNQARQQIDVFLDRLQINAFRVVDIDCCRSGVDDAHFTRSAIAVHADMRQLAAVPIR